jgi:hypothetical protein
VPNPLSLLQAQRDKQYGNSALKAQERDLPPEFKSALWDVTMRQGEASLAPLHVARAMFDDMTFGVPGGITDLVISTASAGSSIANGEYSIAGEKLQGAMLMVLTAAGIKIYRRLGGAVTGAPVQKTLPAGGQHTMPQYGAGQRMLATGESAAASQAGATEIAGATVLELTQEAAAMSKRLSARFDAVQLDSVAELLRSDPQASVFVREHGEAGIAALAESHGNLAHAREVIAKFKTTRGGETVKPMDATAERSSSSAQGAQLAEEMKDLARHGPELSNDAEWIDKTDHAVEAAHNFDWNHVLQGEIKGGKAIGYHSEQAAEGASRITPGAEIAFDSQGVYEAPVQIWNNNSKRWKNKFAKSSFFPADWSIARIKYEVIEAFKAGERAAPVPNAPPGPVRWTGSSPSGVPIEGYVDSNRVTFYPIKGKDADR